LVALWTAIEEFAMKENRFFRWLLIAGFLCAGLVFLSCGNPAQDTDALVESVTALPERASVLPGQTQQFTAVVKGEGQPDQSVVWRIENNNDNGATIDQQGLFTVPENAKPGDYFVIRATSTADSGKYGLAELTVAASNGDSLTGTVWCGPLTDDADSPWATFVFHDRKGLEGTAVYFFSSLPTTMPQQAADPPETRRQSVDYEYSDNNRTGTLEKYTVDGGGGNYSFRLDEYSETLTILNFGAGGKSSREFKRVAVNLRESDTTVEPEFDPIPWTPGDLPDDLAGTVWMGKAGNGGWLTMTVTDADHVVISYSVDNSTNNAGLTYRNRKGTMSGSGGPGDFSISGSVLTFSNFYGHAGARRFPRYR
jgi:hypothetical protein